MKHTVIEKQNNSKLCFVCGINNEFGLKASFYEIENEELAAVFHPNDFHQGYPGRLHGGIASTALDETIGRAILIKDKNIWGVTLELNLKFRKPIPLDKPVKVVARLTEVGTRVFEGTGEIILENGDIAVTAHGKYFKIPLDKITDKEFKAEEWFKIKGENDPEEIEF
ncbi:MAG: PaaI family thioesterase [Chlorobi bacterium]|nr:PaaI family thioesterase [Chlorobiota bacterium]